MKKKKKEKKKKWFLIQIKLNIIISMPVTYHTHYVTMKKVVIDK